jgi:exopolysaccharide production protein ExoQ
LPPLLALLACIVFVLFLLRLERQQSPGMSRSLWLPTVWMLYIGSRPLSSWFLKTGTDPELGSPLDRGFMILLLAAALILIIRKEFNWPRALKSNVPLIVLLGFMFVSISWSNIPFVSLKRWSQELLAIIMAFVVLLEASPRKAIESILRRTIYVLIPFSALLIKYYPKFGAVYGRWLGERMWIGASIQKNGLTRMCFIAIFFLIWSQYRKRKEKMAPVWKYENYVEWLLLVISVWLIRGPNGDFFYSATSFYSLIVGLLAFIGIIIAKKRGLAISYRLLATVTLIMIVFGVLIVFTSTSSIGFAASAAGRDATLTGRTEIWAALLPAAMRNPIIGNGFGGFWTPATRTYYEVSEAHNGYLELLLGLGFSGIVLVSLFYLSMCRKACSLLSFDFYSGVLFVCFILMILVYNLAECSLDSLTYQLSAIVLFFSVSSTRLTSDEQQ